MYPLKMKNLFKNISDSLPLEITTALWEYPNLNLSGENWSLNINCSWRIIDNDKLLCGCEDTDAEEVLTKLKSLSIIEIKPQSAFLPIDPTLILSNSYKLEIFSTTYFEPWIFELPNKPVFVASPSDPKSI